MKLVPKEILRLIGSDTRSTTGYNIRQILRMTARDNLDDVSSFDIENIVYHEIPENEKWRVPLIKEIIEAREHGVHIDNFETDDLDAMLHYACTS